MVLSSLIDNSFYTRKKGKWYERITMNLYHLKDFERSRSFCKIGLNSQITLGYKLSIQKRLEKVETKMETEISKSDFVR